MWLCMTCAGKNGGKITDRYMVTWRSRKCESCGVKDAVTDINSYVFRSEKDAKKLLKQASK